MLPFLSNLQPNNRIKRVTRYLIPSCGDESLLRCEVTLHHFIYD
uniref:Uncharacterized protein n=1 Tax=Arundo donax TaxID=35708 RepID=A0A0A9B381_ARUDO